MTRNKGSLGWIAAHYLPVVPVTFRWYRPHGMGLAMTRYKMAGKEACPTESDHSNLNRPKRQFVKTVAQ